MSELMAKRTGMPEDLGIWWLDELIAQYADRQRKQSPVITNET